MLPGLARTELMTIRPPGGELKWHRRKLANRPLPERAKNLSVVSVSLFRLKYRIVLME